MGILMNKSGFAEPAKTTSGMTLLERAKADLDFARHIGGFAYKQAVAHYKKVLKNSWKGATDGRL